MRSYASISPMFWTRGSGKRLRGDAPAQVVALYLMSSPATSMVGIFHLALPTLCHETGLSLQGATKALRRCSEEGIVFWDESEELVFVPALAQHQIGEKLNPKDLKVKGVVRALHPFRSHRFYSLFIERYGDAYSIPEEDRVKGLIGPFVNPSKGPLPVLSCPDPEIASAPAASSKPKRALGKTPIPADFALTEKHLEHAKSKGYPEWWARNRFEAFVEAAGAKGFTNANWDLALYGSWRREMHEWGNTPAKLAHLAPKGLPLALVSPADSEARARRAAEVEARAAAARPA